MSAYTVGVRLKQYINLAFFTAFNFSPIQRQGVSKEEFSK
jgi:hypothetical protein